MKPAAQSTTRSPPTHWQRRPYQQEVITAIPTRRFFALLWRRQGGKSTTLSEAAHYGMMRHPGLTITYASASLLLGREIVYKESQVFAQAIRMLTERSRAADVQLETVDRETGKAPKLTVDDFADLYEAQRLEFRLWHDRTVFSRTQVIAPNPATARGWTGWVFLDEFGFIRDFRELWEAVEPIVSTDPTFHLVMATTPPRDDAHYSYELTAPPLDSHPPVSPRGTWYTSEAGVDVHRVDIYDAHAAGVKLFDLRSGRELTPEEHFAQAPDKDAWRRNYKVEHVLGGTSAVGLLTLDTAQRRGVGQCLYLHVDSAADLERALAWLAGMIDPTAAIGIGVDIGTTERQTSNPTAVAILESHGVELVARLVLTWKTSDPGLATEWLSMIVEAVRRRRGGVACPPRKVCIDATSERYFAGQLRTDLRHLVPVELVIASQTVERPGHDPMRMKEWLGSRWVEELDDNHVTLPPERGLREDYRLVKKERGVFTCEPDVNGRHGDTFDASKLALHAVLGSAGPIIYRSVPVSPSPRVSALA